MDCLPIKKLTAVTRCPGSNVAYFDKVVTLQQMTDHIYGRTNIMQRVDRPHMFINELTLNMEYLKEQLKKTDAKTIKEARIFAAV